MPNQQRIVIDIFYKDGSKKHVEFYYGHSYLSQSSRKLELTGNVIKAVITSYAGDKREVIKE